MEIIMRIYAAYNGKFGERVIGNLINYKNFCISCDKLCTFCRDDKSLNFADSIIGIYAQPSNLPVYIEEPAKYMPSSLPENNVLLAINLHPDIISELPGLAKDAGTGLIIAPVEEPGWLSAGLINQIKEMIGFPGLKLGVKNNSIATVQVLCSQPCGCAYFVAQKLKNVPVDDKLNEVISQAHHAYPCTASMERDAELKDTILHKAGYIIREAVHHALSIENYR